eukprot:CAMPEP_0178371488 /NCGR_PEP_ID=MMETSP0689_2-20121128/852_1 /TAXON_ID=160604 /ORGANISM="Amphidinium massartii, Strain CS-259" /LENGTH=86 /DNA_ID=CAMNT_0019991359 /DNA_START=103 /DNA_END=363 /DNA_ORIENTATION=+
MEAEVLRGAAGCLGASSAPSRLLRLLLASCQTLMLLTKSSALAMVVPSGLKAMLRHTGPAASVVKQNLLEHTPDAASHKQMVSSKL